MRRRTLFVVTCLLSLLSYGAFAQNFDPNKYYRLTTMWQGEGMSLDVVNDGQNNNIQLAKTGNFSGQAWKITNLGKGYYRLTTMWQGPEKSLDVINDGTNNKLWLANTGNYSGQFWKIQEYGSNVKAGAEVKVDAFTDCQLALINLNDTGGSEYGWWDVWHRIKADAAYQTTPHTYKNLEPGTYVLVVFNPASTNFDPNNGDPNQASDGVVLNRVVVTRGSTQNFFMQQNQFVEWNCLSCPWLYVHNGKDFVRLTEVIQDVVGKEHATTTSHGIDTKYVVDGLLKIRIQEEKEETSYLDRISLVINGKRIEPTIANLKNEDETYVVLEKGENIELTYNLSAIDLPASELTIECHGYYLPKKEFLEAVYAKYLQEKH